MTSTREGIVMCRPERHGGRERGWGSCGEPGQQLGSRWVGQRSQQVVPIFSIRIHSRPRTSFSNRVSNHTIPVRELSR